MLDNILTGLLIFVVAFFSIVFTVAFLWIVIIGLMMFISIIPPFVLIASLALALFIMIGFFIWG